METTEPEGRDELARYVPHLAAAVVLVVAVPLGIVRGVPAVVLWVAFALLAGAVVLFWDALRTALDPTAPGDELDEDDEGVPADLDARKRAALQALKDIEFERSIGRLSEDDFKGLEQKYRDEARAAMKAIDAGLGPWLSKADAMLAKAERSAKKSDATDATKTDDAVETKVDEKTDAKVDEKIEMKTETKTETRACAACETANDLDAVFCKKCGHRLAAEASDAS